MKTGLTAALLIIALLSSAAATQSCSKEGGNGAAVGISIDSVSVNYNASNQYIRVTSDGDWTISLDFGAGSQESGSHWAYLGNDVDCCSLEGSGSGKKALINWVKNNSTEARALTIRIAGNGSESCCTFTQKGRTKPIDTKQILESDDLGKWMELPATNTHGLYYFSHPMQIGSVTTRNFTFAWDTANLVARWVAYPLNRWTISSGTRTNEWDIDPSLPKKYQPILYSPYGGRYDRGHQCPSADRLSYEANVQTFYGTNMTPQLAELNQNAWGVLEGMVRHWASKFDTLYVVTGCIVKGSTDYATDNTGKRVTVPTAYFKALLGYKHAGTIADTGVNGGYTGIAFRFDHHADYSSSIQIMKNRTLTINDLEAETGFDFFANLPPEYEEKIESSISTWWSDNK